MSFVHFKSGTSSHSKYQLAAVTRLCAAVAFLSCAAAGAAENIQSNRSSSPRCTIVISGNEKTIVCLEDVSDLVSRKDQFALGLSALAILISVASLIYSLYKDRTARRRSVEDEFWIRQVLGPVVVEPLISKALQAISELPPDCDSQAWRQGAFLEFAQGFQHEHRQVVSAAHAISLLDKAVCKTALRHLDAIEDAVLNYCGANAGNRREPNGRCLEPQVKTQSRIREEMLAILSAIKDYQFHRL